MGFLVKIRNRLSSFIDNWRIRLKNDRLNRSDVILAHRIAVRRRFPSVRQWQLVGRVLTSAERQRLTLAGYSIFLGIAALAGSWLIAHAVFVPGNGGEYREGIVGSPRAINPILAGGNDVDQGLIRLMFNGLYRRDADANLVFDLAEKMEASTDGKTRTFTLRPDVFFHDGRQVTAEDVVFTVNAILDPAWKSPLAKNLQGVTATAPDARTAVIATKTPSSYLPSLLTFGILPKHIWENAKPGSNAFADYNIKPIGSGPFKFEKFTRDSQGNILSYTVRAANPPSSSSAAGQAKLERITFKFFDDYDTAADKLASNAVDGLNFIPPGKREQIKNTPGIVIHNPAISQYTALFLNSKKNPLLSDANVRQALAKSIDREKIVKEALSGLGSLRDSPLADGTAGAGAKTIRYAYDPAAAGALLDKAGFTVDAETKIRTKTVTTPGKTKKDEPTTAKTELAITITTIDTEINAHAAEIIKENWVALGIKTEIVTASADSIQKSVIKPREYDALLFGEVLGPDADPFAYWHSSQAESGLNLSNYSNRRVDELLEKARIAATRDDRGEQLAEFEQIVTSDAAAIFLYQPDYMYPQSSKIRGFGVSRITATADRFANVTDWYRKFKLTFK